MQKNSSVFKRFCGKISIEEHSQFWEKDFFGCFNLPLPYNQPNESIQILREHYLPWLLVNNPKTSNFPRLILCAVDQLRKAINNFEQQKKVKGFTMNTINLLFLIRNISSLLFEHSTKPEQTRDKKTSKKKNKNKKKKKNNNKKEQIKMENATQNEKKIIYNSHLVEISNTSSDLITKVDETISSSECFTQEQQDDTNEHENASESSEETQVDENVTKKKPRQRQINKKNLEITKDSEKDSKPNNKVIEENEKEQEKAMNKTTPFNHHFVINPSNANEVNVSSLFMDSLVDFLIKVKFKDDFHEYSLVIETVQTLLTFLSSNLYQASKIFPNSSRFNTLSKKQDPNEISFGIETLKIPRKVMWCLEEYSLRNVFIHFFSTLQFEKSKKLSSILLNYSFSEIIPPEPPSSKWVLKSGGGFRKKFKKFLKSENNSINELSRCSLLLFLSLNQVHPPPTNWINNRSIGEQEPSQNGFRKYLMYSRNTNNGMKISIDNKLNFMKLTKKLTQLEILTEPKLLLLYLLLNSNKEFITFFATNELLPKFIVDLLELLFTFTIKVKRESNEKFTDSRSVFLMLAILLILTQNKKLNESLFSKMITVPNWYQKKNLGSESIGNILILVICDLIKIHLPTLKDNGKLRLSFGILSNLSLFFKDISRLCSLQLAIIFDFLTKKVQDAGQYEFDEEAIEEFQQKTKDLKDNLKFEVDPGDYQLNQTIFSDWIDCESLNPPPTLENRPSRLVKQTLVNLFDKRYHEMTHELNSYTDLLVILTEIIQIGVTLKLNKNENLIYTMLNYENQFFIYKDHPRLWKFVTNTLQTISFIHAELSKKFGSNDSYSTEDALSHIKRVSTKFNLKEKGLEIEEKPLFKYIADPTAMTQYFFVYTWDLISRYSGLDLDENILLILRY
ncbi:dymeclin [Anaeramoeba flamelloides]|uniref:Dymeclin n=1 Tax=Anaeramoeba flamelloides TaxID=1746091 RepID=A0AAV8AEA1_9EUKA|nr:dymeclin [Anaeramoeba flamelloides]